MFTRVSQVAVATTGLVGCSGHVSEGFRARHVWGVIGVARAVCRKLLVTRGVHRCGRVGRRVWANDVVQEVLRRLRTDAACCVAVAHPPCYDNQSIA